MTYIPYSLPISVKGILFENGLVWLRKNERQEWEFPGGKLDEGEQPVQTVERELFEELGVRSKAIDAPLDAHVYIIQKSIDEQRGVLVVSYLCIFGERTGEMEYIGEAGNAEFKQFSVNEAVDTNFPMPEFYKQSLIKAAKYAREHDIIDGQH